MASKQGSKVVGPDGRHGVVRTLENYQTGRRGRPPKLATVQLRDMRSRKLTPKRAVYWVSELRAS